MTEYKFFEGDVPYVSTREFHADRERAPHIDQLAHQPRLHAAAAFVYQAASRFKIKTVSDLGCGDGGLLWLLKDIGADNGKAWGYDFQPSNQKGWEERGVQAELRDVFNDRDGVRFGELSVMTEVLEHLADPHGVLRWVSRNSDFLVASSPHTETPESHDACHAWGWNRAGYHELLNTNGWSVLDCRIEGQFHIVLAMAEDW